MQLSHTNSGNELNNNNIEKQLRFGCFSVLKSNPYILLMMLIIVSICMYGINGIYGFSVFPDEFGYWAPAATIVGLDWSSVTSLGSYYSYGYSIILLPILAFFKNSIIAYRVAIIFNLLLQCLSLVLVYKILIKLFPHQSSKILSIAGGAAVLYPAWTFYTQTTMTEGLLNFLFILSVYLIVCFFEKPWALKGIFFVIVLIYMYFVHMRCLGMIGAGALTLTIWAVGRSEKKVFSRVLLLIGLIAILFAISFIIKEVVTARIYSETSEETLSWNDYSGIAYRLSKLFNAQGITVFIKDFAGKALYLWAATYGLAFWGIACLIKKAVSAFRSIKDKNASFIEYSYIFLFLSVFAQFMVAMIYLIGASDPYNDRLDIFLHGRYIDFFLPILIAIGIVEMLDSKHLWLMQIFFVLAGIILMLIARKVILDNISGFVDAHSFTMIGMSYFLKKPLISSISYFFKELALSFSLMAVTVIIVVIYRKFKIETVLLLIIVIQVALGGYTVGYYVFPNQTYIYGDILLGQKLKEIRLENPEKEIVTIYEGGAQYIELVQFADREADITVINAENEPVNVYDYMSAERILIIDLNGDYVDAADNFYEEKWEIGHLNVYYTP